MVEACTQEFESEEVWQLDKRQAMRGEENLLQTKTRKIVGSSTIKRSLKMEREIWKNLE
jgi:hypothetical protein